VRIDSVPTPRRAEGFDTTQAAGPSPVAETLRSGIDARSETGAGVGIPSLRVPGAGRGKWVALGLIVAAAIGVGFLVPKLLAGPAREGAASAAAIVPAPEKMERPGAATAPASAPPSTPALASAPASAPVNVPVPVPVPGTTTATTPVRGGHPIKPTPSATASSLPIATATATAAPTATKPPAGSEDDIK
jgi:hypothetical protein